MNGDPASEPCPVTFALELFGDRWTLIVLRDIVLDGHRRYNDILSANPGLATNILADRLSRLARRGMLEKTRAPSDARKFIYRPTERAISLVPMLLEMIVWSSGQGVAGVDSSIIERFEADRSALIEELQRKVRESIEPTASE